MSVSDFRKSTAALIVGTVTNSLSINNVTISSNSSPRDGWVLVATGSNSAIWRDGIAFGSNATDVGSVTLGGSSASNSRSDHYHRGLGSLSHASNTFYGAITFTTPGNSVGVTSPTPGTLAFTATGGSGGGGTTYREYDYAQVTTVTNITATSEATADTIVTGNAVAYDGTTTVIIEFYAFYAQTAANQTLTVCLYDGAGSIGQIGVQLDQQAAQAQYQAFYAKRRLTPTAGSHTYSIRAFVSGTTGSIGAGVGGSGAAVPTFIRIHTA